MAEQTVPPASNLPEIGIGVIAPAGRAPGGKGDQALFLSMLTQGLEQLISPTASDGRPESLVKTEDVLQPGNEVDRKDEESRSLKNKFFGHSGLDQAYPGPRIDYGAGFDPGEFRKCLANLDSGLRRNDDGGRDMIKIKGLKATSDGRIAILPVIVPDSEAEPADAGPGGLQGAVSMKEASSVGRGLAVSQVMVSDGKADTADPSLGQSAAWDQEASPGGRGIVAFPTVGSDGKAELADPGRFQPSVSVQESSSVDTGITASPAVASDSKAKPSDPGRFQSVVSVRESSSGDIAVSRTIVSAGKAETADSGQFQTSVSVREATSSRAGIAPSRTTASDDKAKPVNGASSLPFLPVQKEKIQGQAIDTHSEKETWLPDGVLKKESSEVVRGSVDKALKAQGSDAEQFAEKVAEYEKRGTERVRKDDAVTLPAVMKGGERKRESGRIGQGLEPGKVEGTVREHPGVSMTSFHGRESGRPHHGLLEEPMGKSVDHDEAGLHKDAKPLREGAVDGGPFRGEGMNIPGVIRQGPGQHLAVERGSIIHQIADQFPKEAPGSGRVHITLNPPHLGNVDMDILIRDNKVRVVMAVEHQDIRNILQQHVGELRSALQDQGVQVGGIDVLLQNSLQGRQDGWSGGGFRWHEERRDRESGEEGEMKAYPPRAAPSAFGAKVEARPEGISVIV